MTALNDLTWQGVATASDIDDAFLAVASGTTTKLMIDVSKVLGIPTVDLTYQGVIDFLIKFREYCVKAQTTANGTQSVGERLAAFPSLIYGNLASDGTVQVQGNIVARMQVSPQNLHLLGVNN